MPTAPCRRAWPLLRPPRQHPYPLPPSSRRLSRVPELPLRRHLLPCLYVRARGAVCLGIVVLPLRRPPASRCVRVGQACSACTSGLCRLRRPRPVAASAPAAAAAPKPQSNNAAQSCRRWCCRDARGRGCRRAAAQMGRGCRACQGASGFLRRAFAQRPRHGRRRLKLTVSFPAGSTFFAIKMLGRADTQSVVLPTVCAVFGRRAVDYSASLRRPNWPSSAPALKPLAHACRLTRQSPPGYA